MESYNQYITAYYYCRELALQEAIKLINQNPQQKITLVFLRNSNIYKLEANLS